MRARDQTARARHAARKGATGDLAARPRGRDLSEAEELLRDAERLVSVPSVSRSEKALADLLEHRLRGHTYLQIDRIGDNVVARSSFGRARRLLLAGHLDTVPPFDSNGPRVEEGVLWGLGSVDMKGGLAVMASLASLVPEAEVDVTFVLYACEEVEHAANGLHRLVASRPDLVRADAAVLLEPTAGMVEAGCQGTIRARLTLGGRRAHTARPYMGVNAVHRLAHTLTRVASYEPRAVVLDGCRYVEQLQAVAVSGGSASNVVPDSATLTVNHRFAPDRALESARKWLLETLEEGTDQGLGDRVEIVDEAPAAAPALSDPLLAALVEETGARPRAKVGWTDVATFATLSVPATNFGPGDPELAHTALEHVSVEELARVREVLGRLMVRPV